METADGFTLNGSKMWITNAGIADVVVVWAKLGDAVRGFLVDTNLPGVRREDIHNKLSMRMSVTSALFLEDVRVGEDTLLPGTRGLGSALACLNAARYSIVWGVCGAAADCLHTAIEYTKEREQFGRPLASFQLVQQKLADMATSLSKAQLLALQLGRLKAAGTLHWSHVSMAKYSNALAALEIARTCRDLLGAAGITDDSFAHASRDESGDGPHLRGHAAHAPAHPGATPDRHQRHLLTAHLATGRFASSAWQADNRLV